MRLLAVAGAVILINPTAIAHSAEIYGELFGGLTVLEDSTWDFSDDGPVELVTDKGFNVGGAAGVGWTLGAFAWGDAGEIAYGMRAEGQITYRSNQGDEFLFVDDTFQTTDDGEQTTLAGMGNIYFDLGTGAPLTLWAGGGVGYARSSVDLDGDIDGRIVDDEDGALAFQVMTGATFNIARYFGLSARYTYFVTDDFEFITDDAIGGEGFDADYTTHNFMLGLVVKR